MDPTKQLQPNTMPYGAGMLRPAAARLVLAHSLMLFDMLACRSEQVDSVGRTVANQCADVAVAAASESADDGAWADVHAAQHSARLRSAAAPAVLLPSKHTR